MTKSLWADFAHHFSLGLRTYFAPLRWLPVWVAIIAATLATGCAGARKPSPDDLADYEAVARLTAYVGCGEIGDSLKASEREALRGSLAVIAAGLDSGRLAGLDAALESLGLRDQGHRLLVTAALQLAVRRIPDEVREHFAVGVTSAAVAGCLDGVKS